jgi:hypothetical protein
MDVLSHQRGLFTHSLAAADPAGWAICKGRFLIENREMPAGCRAGRLSSKPLCRPQFVYSIYRVRSYNYIDNIHVNLFA